MKLFYLFSLALLFSFSTLANSGNVGDKGVVSRHAATTQIGVIGISEDEPFDSPVDNIFHVSLTEAPCPEQRVWLVYELDGVEDHTNVARSVNDQLAVGGHLVKIRAGWAEQREQINPIWLRSGDNVFRFLIAENAAHNYRVRNLRVEIEEKDEPSSRQKVVFNKPSLRYYFDKAYVKGFIPGAHLELSKLKIDGKAVALQNGEFEAVIDFPLEKASCTVDYEAQLADGTVLCGTLVYNEPQLADYIFDSERSFYRVEKSLTQAGGEISLMGSSITVPSNALASASAISITTLRSFDIPALDAGMVNVTGGAYGYRFLPHGTNFLNAAQLVIPFDSTKIPDGYTRQDIRTYYFDETSHHWIALSLDTIVGASVLSSTLHFTDMINGVLKVPESPEAEAYNSTTMKGIKAASPTAAVNLINPPQANNSGGASISYPINIPAGRSGMQPQLGISYSNGGGNGWLGLGWNLTVPSVSIDTRWGVPRYDPANESETYSINGEMLTPVAHRGALVSRSSDKRFYPRVDAAFNKITRRGNNTKNYWWEVIDRSGTKYSYGGRNNQFDQSSVLRTNEGSATADKGHVTHWYLREVRDPNGNTVNYNYEKVSHPGVAGGSPGYQIYIKRINYTGYNGGDGLYEVEFKRDRELKPDTLRADITIMGVLGFKQVTADLLKEIEVKFDGRLVRKYRLKYETGAFLKTLINRIQEYDASDKFFNQHRFTYYNEVGVGEDFKPMGAQEIWQPQTDGVRGKFLVTKDQFTDKASALSGTKGKDFGVGMTVTAGINDGNVANKSLTVGGSFGYSQSESEGLLTLIDLDGDGLTDKVYIKNNKMYYRPNIKSEGERVFGPEREIVIPASTFYFEKSKTTSLGFEANASVGGVGGFVGTGKSKTTSTTSVYLAEVNGDQLPDLVVNTKVYFNRLNASGLPSFDDDSDGTPNPIRGTGSIDESIGQVNPSEKEILINENPLHDVVRLWRAPFSGRIKITGDVTLLQSGSSDREESPADGVIAKIQRNELPELWTADISAQNYQPQSPQGVSDVQVNKGDRIYFRLQSRENGSFDSVRWSPVIEYIAPNSNKQDTLTTADANRKPLYKYSSTEDFIISSPYYVSPPFKGRLRIQGTYVKPVTTDSIFARILKINKETNDTTLVWSNKGGSDDRINETLNQELNMDTTEFLTFHVDASTNVNWPLIQLRPYLYMISSDDPRYKIEVDAEGNLDPLIDFSPVTNYSIFPKMLRLSRPWIVKQGVTSITVKPLLSIAVQPLVGKKSRFIYSIKKTDTLLYKDTINVVNGLFTAPGAKTFNVEEGDSIYVEYHVADWFLPQFMTKSSAVITSGTASDTVKAGLYSRYKSDEENDVIYGPLYRNWGQFIYNGNRERATSPIDEDLLELNDKLKNAPSSGDVDNTEELESDAYNPASDMFIVMTPRGSEKVWGGYDPLTFLDGNIVSTSRMGEDDLSGISASSGGGVRAVNKINKSESRSYSAGLSAGPVGGSYNKTDNAFSHLLVDYVDMNGDRYPDIVTDSKIQYTTPDGGMESAARDHSLGINHKTITNSDGFSISGSFVQSKTEGSATNAKNTRTSVGNARVSGGISGNAGKGDNTTAFTWADINGDGLPDKVEAGGRVALNLGYSFLPFENWGFNDVQKGLSNSKGAGLSVNIGTGSQSASFAAGIGLALSENFITSMLTDMNGDGLADAVRDVNGSVEVKLNTGAGYSSEVLTWNNLEKLNYSSSASQSANVSFTGCFPIWLIKLCVNPSVNKGNSVSRDLNRISDMDGDGYPDYVTSNEDDGDMKVYRSRIGKTNLLKRVDRPLGASFEVTYSQVGNTYSMPNTTWVLDSVIVHDGFNDDGVDKMLTTFQYENGFYDRHEREFYGFSRVTTRTHDTSVDENPAYTIVDQTFNNSNYYEKGLLLSELMTDREGNKYVEKLNRYELRDIESGAVLTDAQKTSDSGKAFPALVETAQKFYEGESDAKESTSTTYDYDLYGNVVSYTDRGDEGTEDDISATIDYYELLDPYIVSSPKKLTVFNGNRIYRERESVIDQSTGDLLQIKQYLSDGETATHDMEYDAFGNLKKIIRPQNAAGQRYAIEYIYDDKVHSYPTKTLNSHGYSSNAEYDFRFGQVLKTVDLNGNAITYQLDDVGRIVEVIGPYEKNGGYTISFEYHPEADVPWALTKHFDPSNPQNALQTSTFVDGMGRVLQTKKDAAIYEGEGKPDKEVMVVSGRIIFDAFGRTVKAYFPITETAGSPGSFNPSFDNIDPTETEFDVLNRTVLIRLPDKSETKTEYGFGEDRDGKTQFSVRTTDANGKVSEEFTDVKGKNTALKNYNGGQAVWTSFRYNPVGEQVEVTNDLGHKTISSYDNLGRKTERQQPESGTTKYLYDLAGNLKEVITANLAQEGLAIEYAYDFERLTEISYPENPENNVKYTYGEAGATDNRAGRIVIQEDASGAQEFFYGPLGEVVKNVRTVVIPQHDEQTYVTEWKYDTWNRLTSMTYADGEIVTYTYNTGGLLRSMSGKKKNASYAYVNQLGYDKFEQRVFLAYGNGTKTSYQYDQDRRRLSHMIAQTSTKRTFMDNVYGYDKVDNILSIKNNATIPSANLMGGSSDYTYEYDDLYRLTSAEGSYKGANDEHSYTLSMQYNSVGGILNKTQEHKRKGTVQKKTTYNQNYGYGETQPNAPIHIGDKTYTYDANGNQTGWTDDVSGQRRKLLWDEENRIRSIYDNGSQHHYIYDAAGDRVIKGKSSGQRIFVNGEWKAGSGQMGNYTVYVNPYLVLSSGGYTKHYYIEGQRVLSKLGGGWDNTGKGPLKAGDGKVDYAGRSQRVFDGIVKNLKFLGADGQILTAGKSGKVPPGQLNGTATGNISEAFRYFYHPDHLGSTSFVTDASGEVYQHLEYTAWGETFVEEHSNTDRTPFLFNGKELDDETGLYYYGARYYDPRNSVFLSVDPLADKYPMFNPYNYAFNNPVRYVDPTGMEGEEPSTYKVQKGNTLSEIAKSHNTTVDALLKANPNIKDKDKIYAGQTINIPGKSGSSETAASATTSTPAPTPQAPQEEGWGTTAARWLGNNSHELGVTAAAGFNAYAGYTQIKAGIAGILAPTGVTQVGGAYLILDGAARIISAPIQIYGTWTGNKSLETAPHNLLGTAGFLIDSGIQGEWRTGGTAQNLLELGGDLGLARYNLVKLLSEGFKHPQTIKRVTQIGNAAWQIVRPYKDGFTKSKSMSKPH